MQSFGVFVFMMVWYVVLYRAFGFVRRNKAKHRQLLIQLGYEELNKPHRIRKERRGRISGIAYVVMSAALYLFGPTLAFRSPGAQMVGALLVSIFPALGLLVGLRFFEEMRVPYSGELFTGIRDKEMRKVAQPLIPDGQLNSGKLIDAFREGLTSPFSVFVPQERAEEKVGA